MVLICVTTPFMPAHLIVFSRVIRLMSEKLLLYHRNTTREKCGTTLGTMHQVSNKAESWVPVLNP